MNIVLIGYRATGKTVVAQQLAQRLGWDWADADVEVELRAGKSIAQIFADDGEGAFRDQESAVLRSFEGRDRLVLAAGGGAVLRPENRAQLKKLGRVIWLEAEVDTILSRLADDPTTSSRRPNLTTRGGRQEVIDLLAQREPLYRQCADLVVATDGRAPEEIVTEILEAFDIQDSSAS